MTFKSLDELRAACLDLPAGNDAAAQAVARRQETLTKPRGSLGKLESIAAWLARWQGRDMPKLDRVKVIIFAGNHGVTAQGVSAYPVRSDGADGGELRRRRRGHQPACPRGRRRPGGHPARPRPPDRRFHARRRRWTRPISLPRSRPAMIRSTRTSISSASAKWASATPRRPRRLPQHCSAARGAIGPGAAPASTIRACRANSPPSTPALPAMPPPSPTRWRLQQASAAANSPPSSAPRSPPAT